MHCYLKTRTTHVFSQSQEHVNAQGGIRGMHVEKGPPSNQIRDAPTNKWTTLFLLEESQNSSSNLAQEVVDFDLA